MRRVSIGFMALISCSLACAETKPGSGSPQESKQEKPAAVLVERSVPAGAKASPETVALADREWRALIEPLLAVGANTAAVFPPAEDKALRYEMHKFLYSQLGAGYMQLVYASPEYPDFIPNWSHVFNNVGLINPDVVYHFTPIDDDGVYKISGFRGTVRIVDFQLGDGSMFAYGRPNEDLSFGPTFANYDIDELTFGEDGSFEFILSARRPAGWSGDWRPLPSTSNYLLARQLSYDWVNEVDARLAIDRLDRPAAKPRQTPDQIQAALSYIPEWAERWVKLSIGPREGEAGQWVDLWQTREKKIILIDFTDDQGGREAQAYINGFFELKPDEAVILEFAPGECRFWNAHLGNELLNTHDLMHRQTSLNGHTARIDADETYRVVVSSEDPGVPNWLDTLGYERGYIWGRFDTCEKLETPTYQKVKIADIRNHLPEDTPEVSAAQREESIRLRRKGAQLRIRW